MRLKLIAGMDFHIGHFDNEISFQVIKYHVNTTRNEMPTLVYQNIGSFWSAAEIKRSFEQNLFSRRFEISNRSSFHLSCERSLHDYTLFYIRNTFISKAKLKLTKNQTKAKPEAELFLFENYSLSLSTFSYKNNRRYSKKCIKNKCVYFNEVI